MLEASAPLGLMPLIWEVSCPACNRVMIAGQVLDQLLERGRRQALMSDRIAARALPQEFLELAGRTTDRVMLLVDRYWFAYASHDRRDLAQMLVILLSPLVANPAITDALREECERGVIAWIERLPAATARP